MSVIGRRRQHTVAKMQLSGFADETGRVAMRRRAGDETLVSVTDATVEKHFYSFHDNAGVRDVRIESWFGEHVEAPAAAILRAARVGDAPAKGQLPIFATYLAAMLMRNKLVRQRFDEIDTHIGPLLTLTEILNSQGVDWFSLPVAEQARWEKVANKFWEAHIRDRDPQEIRRTHLRTMLREIDKLANKLEGWNYVVSDVGADALTTSDTAVAVIEPALTPGWRGILPNGAWLAVPVDPRKVIIGVNGPILNPPSVANSDGHELAKLVNGHIAAGAFDAIFKHPDSSWPTGTTVCPSAELLPIPTRTIRPSEPGSTATFPADYPPVRDARIRALLTALGATDRVD